MRWSRAVAVVAAACALWPGGLNASAQSSTVETRPGVQYASHDGVVLTGDLYLPKAAGKHPALVAVHGGAFQVGNSSSYRHWGPYLAERGYVVFAINYRLVKNNRKMYPEAVQDVRAAVQYLRSRGATDKVDPERIGLIGDSAGAYLSAMVALAGEQPPFAEGYKNDPYAAVNSRVKVCIGVYGVYDLAAAWQSDLVIRPDDRPSEKFLGVPLTENRKIYFEASPISYVTRAMKRDGPPVPGDASRPAFLLAWGTEDKFVGPIVPQNEAFAHALFQAGFFAQSVIVQAAGHGWISEPIDEAGSFSGFLAPRLLRFLRIVL